MHVDYHWILNKFFYAIILEFLNLSDAFNVLDYTIDEDCVGGKIYYNNKKSGLSPEIFDYYKEIQEKDSRVKVVTYTGDFNYSAVNNLGVKYTTGEYILLLNNHNLF